MKALVTGASSGIGYDIARVLSNQGHELILVSDDKDGLKKVKEELGENVKIIIADLSNEAKLKELYVLCKNENVDILVNNAGFGDCGEFTETDINTDIQMINVNIKAVHVLTKLFLKDMQKRNSGYILNVASMAAFSPGPLMTTYYSTKAYVLRLTESIHQELKKSKSNVSVSCLCPGPVDTNFNKVANVTFAVKSLNSQVVASYAVQKMFEKKLIIVPGTLMNLGACLLRILPDRFSAKVIQHIQKKKIYE